jgi:23S rRNA (cytidine1920-2'-O)/16S rRNA (cytidine1409-2'-O)-methyltransferase
MLPYRPDLAVVDVSFISLSKVLRAIFTCMTERNDVFALVKPQFELERGRVGKGGVVRRASDRRDALVCAGEAALSLGAAVLGFYPSRLDGPKGNRETFIWLAEAGRAQARSAADLPALALEADP